MIADKTYLSQDKYEKLKEELEHLTTVKRREVAEKLGLNLKTLRGNMAYAKYLYEKEGVAPWKSSSSCWDKYVSIGLK